MKIGIVCPYSWEVHGGVQLHVGDLAAHLIGLGHEVSVLAPADEDSSHAPYIVPGGRAVPVPYNGSVARLNFGFLSAARVRRWLHDGDFDVLHLHEPGTPSLSLLACWAASCPIVATFHTANQRSRAMTAAYPILQPALEKINARIAVSEYARRTLVEHLGGDAVVIPNGVDVDFYRRAEPVPEWTTPEGDLGPDGKGGTIGFIGRFEESRKGLPVLVEALPAILAARPNTRLLLAGRGDADEALRELPAAARENVVYLGAVSDQDKARLMRSVDIYCAPNTGGESFGIILVEAMSAGAPVLASDLDAFSLVLEGGAAGRMFPNGDAAALAAAALDLLADPSALAELSRAASDVVRRYDWSVVAADILSVYEMVTESTAQVNQTYLNRQRGGSDGDAERDGDGGKSRGAESGAAKSGRVESWRARSQKAESGAAESKPARDGESPRDDETRRDGDAAPEDDAAKPEGDNPLRGIFGSVRGLR